AFGAEVQAASRLVVGANWTHTSTESAGDRSDSQLRVALRGPLTAAVSLQRIDAERDGTTLGALWNLAAGTRGWLKLEGKSTERLAPTGTTATEASYRLEATPVRGVKLAALTTTRDTPDQPATENEEASVEVAPIKALSLGGSLGTSTQGDTTTTITSVSGTV